MPRVVVGVVWVTTNVWHQDMTHHDAGGGDYCDSSLDSSIASRGILSSHYWIDAVLVVLLVLVDWWIATASWVDWSSLYHHLVVYHHHPVEVSYDYD